MEKARAMRIAAILMIAMCFASCVFAAPAKQPADGIKPDKIKPLIPETIQDMADSADAIILGNVIEVKPDPAQPDMENRDRQPMIARVKIEKTYKGNLPEGEIGVGFTHSTREMKPALVELKKGERCVMFLQRPRDTQYFEFVSPFSGKEKPADALLTSLEKAAAALKLNFAVEAEIMAAEESKDGGPQVLFVMENKGATPVLFNATPDAAADLIVTGPDGKVLQPLVPQKKNQRVPLLLAGGQFFGYRADLSQMFGNLPPGDYSVQASFRAPAGDLQIAWSGIIETKPVTVSVK